jgi:hypothetical protein
MSIFNFFRPSSSSYKEWQPSHCEEQLKGSADQSEVDKTLAEARQARENAQDILRQAAAAVEARRSAEEYVAAAKAAAADLMSAREAVGQARERLVHDEKETMSAIHKADVADEILRELRANPDLPSLAWQEMNKPKEPTTPAVYQEELNALFKLYGVDDNSSDPAD